jgi:Flp pilus assembly pilin Flp
MEEIVKTLMHMKGFLKDESGAELAEYAVAAALLVAIAIVVYEILGDAISDSNTGTAAKVASATWTAP